MLDVPIRSSRHEATTHSSSSLSSRRKSIATRASTKSHASPAAEHALDPLVAALLEVGRVDGVVDVLVRVDVAPADLDSLLVHHARELRPFTRTA